MSNVLVVGDGPGGLSAVGAAAALDILSKEAGKDVHDFDVVK